MVPVAWFLMSSPLIKRDNRLLCDPTTNTPLGRRNHWSRSSGFTMSSRSDTQRSPLVLTLSSLARKKSITNSLRPPRIRDAARTEASKDIDCLSCNGCGIGENQ
eukprot:Blabericola_migrator_1__3160@NODE_1922_length_3555_cov_190_978211_g1229_i0_p7_GENE_NODE_1922_length_3555_cov_190_978211_g1229_i0NODE_1922_length_3555_cov_190_978211_g1229_i0_p7_ORF_typecomplete_len104_score5_50_NODE_1922_length_3555_cov_190_978211_g1229_i0117428